jgi:hypothetical protein
MPIEGKQSIDIWSNAYVAAINELGPATPNLTGPQPTVYRRSEPNPTVLRYHDAPRLILKTHSFHNPKARNYGFLLGLGNPPGFVVVGGVFVPEGWAEDLVLGVGVLAGRLALSLVITTSLRSIFSFA